ncbi:MAG: hypothetical protein ACFCVH_04710 [Alphaproteobacteria bacterium]
MSRMPLNVFRAAVAALFVGVSTSSAYAYLDPGTGAMILQLLLGGVAGIALVGKLYWHRLTSIFRRAPVEAELEKERPEIRH